MEALLQVPMLNVYWHSSAIISLLQPVRDGHPESVQKENAGKRIFEKFSLFGLGNCLGDSSSKRESSVSVASHHRHTHSSLPQEV